MYRSRIVQKELIEILVGLEGEALSNSKISIFRGIIWLPVFWSGNSGESQLTRSSSAAFCTRILSTLWKMNRIKFFTVLTSIFLAEFYFFRYDIPCHQVSHALS